MPIDAKTLAPDAKTLALDPKTLAALDATAQAELVRTGEATPAELVDAAIERLERSNPELNAVIHPALERARDRARDPQLPNGPFRTGSVGPKTATTGTSSAEARCIGPVSPLTTRRARRR